MKFYLVNSFYFLIFLTLSSPAFSQQEYFMPQTKKLGLEHFKNKIYRGCSDLKEKQDPVPAAEMERLVTATKKIVEENFKKAFAENPKVHLAFKKDINSIMRDAGCQRVGNDCRAKLLALSLYYYQQFRPDLPDCEDKLDNRCTLEEKYREANLQGARNNYGTLGPGSYKKELIAQKNNTTIKLFNLIMHKDKINLHICNEVRSGIVHQYALNLDEEGEYQVGMDPDFNPNAKVAKACVDEKKILLAEFLQTELDASRTTVGQDQVEPVKHRIMSFLKSNSDMIVTDISVTASSAKTPFYTTVAGKKKIDPKSNDRNLSLASDRSVFVARALTTIKSSDSQFSHINMSVKAELAGPEFVMMDLNNRFVTKMSPGYLERLTAIYNQNSKAFKEEALINAPEDLLDEKKFSNLYLAKYKPFEGYKIQIHGFIKSEMKCLERPSRDSSKSGSSKQ